jgi:hypothetical protein
MATRFIVMLVERIAPAIIYQHTCSANCGWQQFYGFRRSHTRLQKFLNTWNMHITTTRGREDEMDSSPSYDPVQRGELGAPGE